MILMVGNVWLLGLGEGDSALNSDKDEDDWPGGNSSGASYSTGTTPSPTDHTKQTPKYSHWWPGSSKWQPKNRMQYQTERRCQKAFFNATN